MQNFNFQACTIFVITTPFEISFAEKQQNCSLYWHAWDAACRSCFEHCGNAYMQREGLTVLAGAARFSISSWVTQTLPEGYEQGPQGGRRDPHQVSSGKEERQHHCKLTAYSITISTTIILPLPSGSQRQLETIGFVSLLEESEQM